MYCQLHFDNANTIKIQIYATIFYPIHVIDRKIYNQLDYHNKTVDYTINIINCSSLINYNTFSFITYVLGNNSLDKKSI